MTDIFFLKRLGENTNTLCVPSIRGLTSAFIARQVATAIKDVFWFALDDKHINVALFTLRLAFGKCMHSSVRR